MTKKEAIDLLDNLIGMIEDNHGSDYDSAIRMAIDALESKWIPCSERLPELYKPVLVTGGDIIWICELIESPDLDDGEFQWEDKMLGHWYSFDNWDAWMPLPEPYEKKE